MSARLPRDLHPVAWWLWAIGLATAATVSTNPLWMLLLIAISAVVVFARRSDQPWGRSFRLYCTLAAAVVAMRLLFRVLLAGGLGETVLVDLPEIPLPDWVMGVTLLGPVTRESLLAGLYDGLRLAAIIVCVGAANSLANPKRLLASMPAALHEVGTALVVSVTVLPQLADSARRVRAAQQLRGGAGGRVRGLRRLLVPVLEDALERSVRLAAGMDTRGYGRSGGASSRERAVTGTLMIVGLLGLCVGAYGLLDQEHALPRWAVQPMLWGGLALAIAGLVSAGRRVGRTRYRATRWQVEETVVVLTGIAVAAVAFWVADATPLVAYPGLEVAPTLTATALGGVLLGLLPAMVAPRPPHPLGSTQPEVRP